jgi:phage gp46-like protein
MNLQQGDVLLCQTSNDGDISVEGGITAMSPGLETAAYLALFGGNEDDDGRGDNKFNWWGNLDEEEESRKYRSETQNLLQSLPPTSGNLLRIKDAVQRDYEFFISEGIATSIDVSVSIPALNRIKISADITADSRTQKIEFEENWRASL